MKLVKLKEVQLQKKKKKRFIPYEIKVPQKSTKVKFHHTLTGANEVGKYPTLRLNRELIERLSTWNLDVILLLFAAGLWLFVGIFFLWCIYIVGFVGYSSFESNSTFTDEKKR